MRSAMIASTLIGLGFAVLSAPTAYAGDAAAAGRLKAEGCLGCHGIEGYRNAYPSYRVPKIGGQTETYLVAALKAYRSGERQHPTMQAQGASLSDEDIADLAAWLASYSDKQ